MEDFINRFKDFVDRFKELLGDLQDTTDEYETSDVYDNRWLAVISYLSLLCLVPIIMDKLCGRKSRFALYHANQGLVLTIIWIVAPIVLNILAKLPLIGWIFVIANMLVKIGGILLFIMGIVYAANGKAKELPFIGKIKLIK